MDGPSVLKDLKFISNDYIIYKNGKDVTGHCYGYRREISIRKNREVEQVYNVTIYKLDGNRIADKFLPRTKMILVDQDNLHIQITNPAYGLILGLHNNSVQHITLKRYDNNTDIFFIKAPSKELVQAISIPLPIHLAGLNDSVDKAERNELIERYYGIVKEMETKGSAIEAMAGYYLFLGKLQSGQGAYRDSKEAFTQSLMMLAFSGLQPNHEAIYRYGLVKEMEGNISEAKMFYRLALDRYSDNAGSVSRKEIKESLNR